MKVITIKTISNMENSNNNSINSVIIPSRRIPIENWQEGVMALDLNKKNETYMQFVTDSLIFTNGSGYAILIVDKNFPTQRESYEFVQKMMRDSNFAKADKIKFVLYRNNVFPFAVVVENF